MTDEPQEVPGQPAGIHIRMESIVFDGVDPSEVVIPESVTAEVVESDDGTPLAGLVERLGGFSGTIIDHFDQQVPVSLEQWRNADPQTTRVVLRLRYQPRR